MMLLLVSCGTSVKPGNLYGKWKYIKVEHPGNPDDTVHAETLAANSPYIQFTNDNKVLMMWGGRLISHGTFTTDGNNIKVKEELDGGQTREFPFWVISLTDKNIVFETTTGDKSRVTAVKE
jgi:hypothetical protein